MEIDLQEIIEKIKREKNTIQKAKIIRFLTKEKQTPLKILSKELQVTPSYICHMLRLNTIPDTVIDGYYAKLLSLSHLFVLSRIKDSVRLIELYGEVLENNLTVLQTEERVREYLYGIKSEGDYIPNEEKQQFIEYMKSGEKDLHIKITQTRIKAVLLFEIQGSLEHTSATLRKLMRKMKK